MSPTYYIEAEEKIYRNLCFVVIVILKAIEIFV